MGVSGSQLEALKIIEEQGGETSAYAVSRRMNIEPNYARFLCTSLARADYVGMLPSGKLSITVKGKRALEKK